ncbi:MAG: hypothetical protein EPN91_12205 [Salinibacterium sp.]|nr:MAG: hypothetical protein EPN91_12205 [Salinibacterium sp.]
MKRHIATVLMLTVLLAGCAPEPTPTGTTPSATPTPTATQSRVPDPAKFQAMDPTLFFVDQGLPPNWGMTWDTKDVNFRSPSRNIGCAILGPETQSLWSCTIVKKSWEFPTDAPSDYCYQSPIPCGDGIEASDSELPHPRKHGDPGYPAGIFAMNGAPDPIRVLQYGQSVTFGNVTCYSETIGVTCVNNVSGHGFVIAKDRNDIF